MSAAPLSDAVWSLSIPEGWHELPEPGENPAPRIQEIIESLDVPESSRSELAREIFGLLGLVSQLKPGHRRSYGFVADPALGIADAVLSVRFTKVFDDAHGEYLTAVEESTVAAPIRLVNREVSEARVPAGRVVLLSDVLVLDDQQGIVSPAVERAIAALFLDSQPVLLEVYVSTQNLGRFVNIAEFALDIAAGYGPDNAEG